MKYRIPVQITLDAADPHIARQAVEYILSYADKLNCPFDEVIGEPEQEGDRK